MLMLTNDFFLLSRASSLNALAFAKILKKHDKVNNNKQYAEHTSTICHNPFVYGLEFGFISNLDVGNWKTNF